MTASNRRHVAMRSALLGSVAFAGAAVMSTAAFAQEDDASMIQEIVVTAQKRAQNLQDVPIAVTAVTTETLQANRVTSIADLTGLAPGLVSRPNAGSLGSPSFIMRGVFASASQPSSDRQISTYLDGVYIGSTRGGIFDLPDLQRIEVLRGPQGTLFGRNSTAGAISVVTRDPTGDFHFRQEFSGGNKNQIRTRTSVDLPQMGPFSAYVTYVHDEKRGDIRNLGAGTTFDRTSPYTDIGVTRSPKWLGSRNFENVFGALKFEPTDTLSMVYKYDRSHGDITPEARDAMVINPASFVGSTLLSVLAAQPPGGGRYGPVFINGSGKRPDAVNNAWSQPGYQHGEGHSLTTNWRVNEKLSVKNITAYRKTEVYGASSILGLSGLQFTPGGLQAYATFAAFSANPSLALAPQTTQAQVIGQYAAGLAPAAAGGLYFAGYEGNSWGKSFQESTETQVNYDSDFVTLTVGGLYYHAKETSSGLPGMAPNFAFQPLAPQLPLGNVQEAQATTLSIAAYVQGEFHVTDQIDILAGGRITKDKKRGQLTSGGTFVGSRTAGDISGARIDPWEFKKSKPTFSVGVNYKPNDDTLLYAKYSTGFLSGGAVGPFVFAPETVKSAEVGAKSDFFDRRLRANLAIWQATYHHIQSSQSGTAVNQPQLGVIVVDNGTMKAKGFELEVIAAPVHGLTLGGSVGYTDTELKNPNPALAQGKRYVGGNNPKWVGSTYAQYNTDPVMGEAFLSFRIDANYQAKTRTIPDPDIERNAPAFAPAEFIPSRWIANARVAVRDVQIGKAKGEVALWSKNLFDNKDILYSFQFGDIGQSVSYQPARTYGVDLILSF